MFKMVIKFVTFELHNCASGRPDMSVRFYRRQIGQCEQRLTVSFQLLPVTQVAQWPLWFETARPRKLTNWTKSAVNTTKGRSFTSTAVDVCVKSTWLGSRLPEISTGFAFSKRVEALKRTYYLLKWIWWKSKFDIICKSTVSWVFTQYTNFIYTSASSSIPFFNSSSPTETPKRSIHFLYFFSYQM